jgi:hypothetical protein
MLVIGSAEKKIFQGFLLYLSSDDERMTWSTYSAGLILHGENLPP